jgi:hypothetical protein
LQSIICSNVRSLPQALNAISDRGAGLEILLLPKQLQEGIAGSIGTEMQRNARLDILATVSFPVTTEIQTATVFFLAAYHGMATEGVIPAIIMG